MQHKHVAEISSNQESDRTVRFGAEPAEIAEEKVRPVTTGVRTFALDG
jgi:hypothetical protein